MTPYKFVRKFNRLQDKTCSKLIARLAPEDKVCIYRIRDGREPELFAYSTYFGYLIVVNQEDYVLVTPKTLKLMAKFLKSIYNNHRK